MATSTFCPSCGTRVEPGSTACPTCGTPVGGSPATATSAGGRVAWAPVALVAVGVVMALVAVFLARGDDGGGEVATGEVFLEAADAPGPDAFTDAVDPAAPASSVVATPVSGPVPAPPAGIAPLSGTAPAPGSPPYGGSGDDRVCDREQLVSFLTGQPERAEAWAGVLGVEVADIPAYVRSLTPTVLLYDTRVTNHGFSAGRATPRQSVLQAGTAVLVDGEGDPVVRCRCGNPLLAPAPLTRPTVVGSPWPGYTPSTLVRVEAGVTVTVSIEVTLDGGSGSTGSGSSSTATSTTTSTTTPTTTSPPATATTAPATSTTAAGLTDLDRQTAEGLIAAVTECLHGDPVTLVDVEPLEGFTGGFTITLDVGGTRMLFVYEPATGTITEGDRASAELIAECGVM